MTNCQTKMPTARSTTIKTPDLTYLVVRHASWQPWLRRSFCTGLWWS